MNYDQDNMHKFNLLKVTVCIIQTSKKYSSDKRFLVSDHSYNVLSHYCNPLIAFFTNVNYIYCFITNDPHLEYTEADSET